jgi:hypothetical protein
MAAHYGSAREHSDEAIALIAQLVERQIRAHWELGILPRIKDGFSGTFVGGQEVRALMAGGNEPAEEGRLAIERLDGVIRSRAERIEAKLAAAREAGAMVPFDRLRRAFGLTPTEERALWVLIAVEISAPLRQLMRYLVNEASRVHADVGLLEILVYSAPETRDLLVRELAPDSRVFRFRLIEPVGSRRQVADAPYLLRPLRAARRIIELVSGFERLDPDVAPYATLVSSPAPADQLVMAEATVKRINRLLEHADAGTRQPAVVLAGKEGAGRRSLALGAAASRGLAALLIHSARLPSEPAELAVVMRAILREAVLFAAVPVFVDIDVLPPNPDLGLPDRITAIDQALDGYAGPVMGTCGVRDSRPVALGRGLVMVDVPVPSEADRVTLWRRALGERASDLDVNLVAARYPITGGIILRAADAALSLARAGGGALDASDVHVGLRSALSSQLSGLGSRVLRRQRWEDLVLSEDHLDEIREFIARVRHRRRVYDDWGFAAKMAKGLGLSALFAGPPGTGKTMVAGIIADELALDLYQIDLSRIVSKYVGETEKNLAQLFDAAEAGHAILLFDEADSLFAKRTEVKSSVDRYANLEVNYLLQRMEAFNGITILTTNLDSSIDDAFRRRISFRVDFPFPEPEDRLRLWQTMLPERAAVADDIDFEVLSEKYEMTGGYIRNAVLRAAFLAADEDSTISMGHLVRAANLEYQAMGKVVSSLS